MLVLSAQEAWNTAGGKPVHDSSLSACFAFLLLLFPWSYRSVSGYIAILCTHLFMYTNK